MHRIISYLVLVSAGFRKYSYTFIFKGKKRLCLKAYGPMFVPFCMVIKPGFLSAFITAI